MESHPQVYVCTISARYEQNENGTGLHQLSTAHYSRNGKVINEIKNIAAQNSLEVIDVNAATSGHPDWYRIDGIHPDINGAKQIANTVFAALQNE